MNNQRFSLAVALIAAVHFLAPTSAHAFCGFYVGGGDAKLYNDATQVVLMRHGGKTALSMQNNYEGPAKDFAMVVPVPVILQKENVKTLPKTIFDRVDKLSAPRLVEYWERDPCYEPPDYADGFGFGGLGLMGSGRGGGGLGGLGSRGYVRVEAEFEVGEYDIVVLASNDAAALDTWLREGGYNIPAGAEPYFRPYIEAGQYFFVAKVNLERAKYENDRAVLSPLRFHYHSEKFELPIRLGMINSKGQQDLLIYILADKQRYNVANYPNVTIPSNIEVANDVRFQFFGFYEALFSRTIEENPKAVVTEYAWQASKCDPCPSGMRGGAALRQQDFMTLGADVLKARSNWGWVLTRLHARYSKEDIGEDFVFQKAEPIVGGREIRTEDGSLEKGATPASNDNFQGRYIIRHEWEGAVACDNPKRGVWGGPPNPTQMKMVEDVVVAELRRQKAAAENREPTEDELAAPPTPEELKAVSFHLRRKFGTSYAPAGGSGPVPAASPNTRGVAANFGAGKGVGLSQLVLHDVPEVKLTAEKAGVKPTIPDPVYKPAGDGASAGSTTTGQPDQPVKDDSPKGCATAVSPANSSLMGLLLLALVWLRRRRRT